MVFLNAVQGVLSIIFMIGIGYFISRRGWVDDKSSGLLTKLVVNIALPSYMISNLMTTYDKDKLMNLLKGAAIPFITMGLSLVLGVYLAKVLKLPANRKGTFASMFSMSTQYLWAYR